jgi:NAD+-dependent farnesol dehydrogenase
MSMESYFITGATGFIGKELTRMLIREQVPVTVLVRNREKMAPLAGPTLNIVQGDILDYETVESAMKGCTRVFHLAAYARSYAEEPGIFEQINVTGTEHILKAALKNGVTRIVFTSTAGTFNTTDAVTDQTEKDPKPDTYNTEYARTKRMAEILCAEYSHRGLSIVTVYPTRVYGPGVLSESNSVVKMLDRYSRGHWRVIPSDGKTYGNYVFIDDVVKGHMLAMEKGTPGEGYILGGENVTFNGLFNAMREASGKTYRLIHIPYLFLLAASAGMVLYARLTGTRPLITPSWVKRYLQHRRLSSDKAIGELGYTITPLCEGFRISYGWLTQIRETHAN